MMINNNNKRFFYVSIWNKYLPIIRILIKRAASNEQILAMNRIDFERAGSARKSGYKFTVNFVKGRPDTIFAGNELAQSLTSALQTDEVLQPYLLKDDYTFTFTSKFQLLIKNNRIPEEVVILNPADEQALITK